MSNKKPALLVERLALGLVAALCFTFALISYINWFDLFPLGPTSTINFVDGYDFGRVSPPPVSARKRTGGPEFHSHSLQLFDHPKVKNMLDRSKTKNEARRHCFKEDRPNMDVYYRANKKNKGLLDLGVTVFALDCRSLDPENYRLFGAIVAIDARGNVINILSWDDVSGSEIESITMYNTTTTLLSSGGGAYLWNFATDVLESLPFKADTHSLVYRYTDDRFYGLFDDDAAMADHNVQGAVSFDPHTGRNHFSDPDAPGWSFYYERSHFNYLTVGGDFAYASSRQLSCLLKIDMRTNEVVWMLGGTENSFQIYDVNGVPYEKNPKKKEKEKFPWNHQHKFQYLGSNYFSLFDNNVGLNQAPVEKPWGTSSRNVVLWINEDTMEAWEVFSYTTGDESMSYGGSEVLPGGNLLTNSYVSWVYPTDADHQYHVSIWEVNMETNEIEWRIGFKGLNPAAPDDLMSPYPHTFHDPTNPDSTAPTGWNIYNVDRAYPTVLVMDLCLVQTNEDMSLQFTPYNTIRTQADAPGIAALFMGGELISQRTFLYQRGWIPRPEQIRLPSPLPEKNLVLRLNNQWNNPMSMELDLSEISACG